MEIIKKTYSKNNNEIVLIEQSRVGLLSHRHKIILVIGVVHGDEAQGKFLIENYLNSHLPEGKNRVLFIPCLNPDGMAQNTRQNANGVDINRNFLTKNWELTQKDEYFGGEAPLSEIETQFVVEVIEEYLPDIILTLHSPYKVVNYDGPAKEFADKISDIIGYPTSTDIGYPTPGSFGNYAGVEKNIPTITLELDEEIEIEKLISPVSNIFNYLAFV